MLVQGRGSTGLPCAPAVDGHVLPLLVQQSGRLAHQTVARAPTAAGGDIHCPLLFYPVRSRSGAQSISGVMPCDLEAVPQTLILRGQGRFVTRIIVPPYPRFGPWVGMLLGKGADRPTRPRRKFRLAVWQAMAIMPARGIDQERIRLREG